MQYTIHDLQYLIYIYIYIYIYVEGERKREIEREKVFSGNVYIATIL